MARLHKEFTTYNNVIKLDPAKKNGLLVTRRELRRKIRKWFKENRPNELPPKFGGQGSIEMGTAINPIPVYDAEQNKYLYAFDLDDGIYFIEVEGGDNRRSIATWHDWVFDAVDSHTGVPSDKKNTCIRVNFADGHNIDLPIYYKNGDSIELAHKSKGWIPSDPKEFYEWFNNLKNAQLERIVRYLKGWKNFRELNNNSLKLPSGFELTILAANNYVEDEFDDKAMIETVRKILTSLESDYKCLRPTTPQGEDVFEGCSETKRENFLGALRSLLNDLERAANEKNFKKASEILANNQFGNRFPIGPDKDEEDKSKGLGVALGAATIKPKPYGY